MLISLFILSLVTKKGFIFCILSSSYTQSKLQFLLFSAISSRILPDFNGSILGHRGLPNSCHSLTTSHVVSNDRTDDWQGCFHDIHYCEYKCIPRFDSQLSPTNFSCFNISNTKCTLFVSEISDSLVILF